MSVDMIEMTGQQKVFIESMIDLGLSHIWKSNIFCLFFGHHIERLPP